MMSEKTIYQNKSPQDSFFPLFATTPRVQTSQSLYYLKPTPSGNENIHTYPSSVSSSFSRGPQLSNNSDPYSRGEWGKLMPQQSLLDQMSSGAIFLGNSSYQNQTVTQYNPLYYQTNVKNLEHNEGEMLYAVYIRGGFSSFIKLSNKDFAYIILKILKKYMCKRMLKLNLMV
jgi:hypothetical protein